MAANGQNPEAQITGSDPAQEYVLKTGSHTWIDGKTYVAGDKIQLTKDQMERIGSERFEPVSVSAKKEVATESTTDMATGTATDSVPNPNVKKTVEKHGTSASSGQTKS